jgi:hypothetical protein
MRSIFWGVASHMAMLQQQGLAHTCGQFVFGLNTNLWKLMHPTVRPVPLPCVSSFTRDALQQ